MKILSAETNLGSATNVSNAPVVRLFNSGASNILVTQKDYQGANEGTFMVMSGDVVYCEKYYTDTLEGSADVKATKTAYSSMMKFVGASVAVPTYTHAVSATNVDEGGSFTTTITTTNVDDGTNLYWELSGTNVTSDDFSSGALTGTASISSNSATFSHTVANDTLTEGTETVTIKVYSDSGRNTQVGNTLTVTLADTSLTPSNFSVLFNQNAAEAENKEYLIADLNSDFAAGTGDFQAECFFRTTQLFGYNSIMGTRNSTGNVPAGWTLGLTSSGIYVYSDGFHVSGGPAISLNQWYHAAVTRVSGTLKIYLDGTLVDTRTNHNYNYTNLSLNIGKDGVDCSYGCQPFSGYISNVRFIKGSVTYTSNFTVPTANLTATSQGASSSDVKLVALRNSNKNTSTVGPNLTDGPQGSGTSSTVNPF